MFRRIPATAVPTITTLRHNLGYGDHKKIQSQSFYDDVRAFRKKYVTSSGMKGRDLHEWKNAVHQDCLLEMANAYLDASGNGPLWWPEDETMDTYSGIVYSIQAEEIRALLIQLFFRLNLQQYRNTKYRKQREFAAESSPDGLGSSTDDPINIDPEPSAAEEPQASATSPPPSMIVKFRASRDKSDPSWQVVRAIASQTRPLLVMQSSEPPPSSSQVESSQQHDPPASSMDAGGSTDVQMNSEETPTRPETILGILVPSAGPAVPPKMIAETADMGEHQWLPDVGSRPLALTPAVQETTETSAPPPSASSATGHSDLGETLRRTSSHSVDRPTKAAVAMPRAPQINVDYHIISRTQRFKPLGWTPNGRFTDKTLTDLWTELPLDLDSDPSARGLRFTLLGPENLEMEFDVAAGKENELVYMKRRFATALQKCISKSAGPGTLYFDIEIEVLRDEEEEEEVKPESQTVELAW